MLAGQAGLHLCGATVQAPPHIGHIRSGVSFDVVVRWLKTSGLSVTFCRNVTDIDDKILRVAAAEGSHWWAVAERNQRAFTRAYDMLGRLLPDVERRATGDVPELIMLTGAADRLGPRLRGRRRVSSACPPGAATALLSAQRPEHMLAGRRRRRRELQAGSARLRALEGP